MKPLPTATILRAYFWPFSIEELAYGFTTLCGRTITTWQIESVWAEEAAHNPLLNQARPAKGFAPGEGPKLFERLVAA